MIWGSGKEAFVFSTGSEVFFLFLPFSYSSRSGLLGVLFFVGGRWVGGDAGGCKKM